MSDPRGEPRPVEEPPLPLPVPEEREPDEDDGEYDPDEAAKTRAECAAMFGGEPCIVVPGMEGVTWHDCWVWCPLLRKAL